MHEIIRFHKIHFEYDQTPILKDVSLCIYPGEFIHVIGPNGGGKTTLIKLIMGILSPRKGNVKVYGQSPKNKRENFGYIPQSLQFDPIFPLTLF